MSCGGPVCLRIPSVGENQKVGANQSQASVWRGLVDHDLGTRGIQDAAAFTRCSIHIVKPHGARVGAAHAAELKGIALRLSHRHIFEALGGFPDGLDKSTRFALLRPARLVARPACASGRPAPERARAKYSLERGRP